LSKNPFGLFRQFFAVCCAQNLFAVYEQIPHLQPDRCFRPRTRRGRKPFILCFSLARKILRSFFDSLRGQYSLPSLSVTKMYTFCEYMDFSGSSRYNGAEVLTVKERKPGGNSILRCILVGVSLLFQVGWMLLLILRLNEYSAIISLATGILSFLLVLQLHSRHTTSAMKMPWIMLILVFPVMGLSLYLLIVLFGDLGSNKKHLKKLQSETRKFLTQEPNVFAELEKKSSGICWPISLPVES
jgi:hypothetical protein